MKKIKRWYGLSPRRFRKYASWKNTHKPGLCGTYVVAAVVDDFLRQEYDVQLSKDQLLTGIKPIVDGHFPYKGTYMWDLTHGLNYLLQETAGVKAQAHLFPDFIVPERVEAPYHQPVAVGTSTFLNSSYGNHWLLAYAYGYDQEGKLHFKCYDNHGRHQAVIPASQTLSAVWLEKK